MVVTLLGVTISLPHRNDNAASAGGRDDPSVPNGTQQIGQPSKGGGFPRPGHPSVDVAPSRNFPSFQPVSLLA